MKQKITLFLSFFLFSAALSAQPTRDWVSYYGGQLTGINAVIYEPRCNCLYVSGTTADTVGIATSGSFKDDIGPLETPDLIPEEMLFWQFDAFLAKFDLAGNRLWATYFGGDSVDLGNVLASDQYGNVFIAGTTNSPSGIGTTGAYLPDVDTGQTAYLIKFNEDGERAWGTYLGPSSPFPHIGAASVFAVQVAGDGSIYAGGGTGVSGFASPGAFKESIGGVGDGFLVKLNQDGERVWGTYVGGDSLDEVDAIHISPNGFVYVGGNTTSDTGLATPGTFQESWLLPGYGSYINKFSPSGERIWGTYLNGQIASITGDSVGNIYVYGFTENSTGVATAGTHQEALSGITDVFLMKFDSAGHRIWGTYYGGEGQESVYSPYSYSYHSSSLKMSPDGQYLYLSAFSNYGGFGTPSPTGVATECAYATGPNKGGILARFDTTGQLVWGSFYDAGIFDIAVHEEDGVNAIYLAGRTDVDGLATPGSFKDNKTGLLYAAYLGRFTDTYACPLDTVALSQSGTAVTATAGFSTYNWYLNGTAITGASGNSYTPASSDSGALYAVAVGSCGCTYTSDTVFISPTGIGAVGGRENSFSLYPNPAGNKVTVVLFQSGMITGSMEASVTDMYGKVCLNKEVPGNKAELDVSLLANGVYFITVGQGKGGRKATRKLVISR